MSRITNTLRGKAAQFTDLHQRATEEEHIVRMGLLATGAARELGSARATLSIVNVARTLGGTVQACNQPEGGAAVTLTLPLSAIALDKEL